jgi:adenylate cyclase
VSSRDGLGMIEGTLELQLRLQAFLRTELAEPASTVAGLAGSLVERHGAIEAFRSDLDRIGGAGEQLLALLAAAEAAAPDPHRSREEVAALNPRLRHDLRTPINGIKGYGEMLVDDARAGGYEALASDLGVLLAAADRLLTAVNALAALEDRAASPEPQAETLPRELVSSVRDSIRLVSAASEARDRDVPCRILVVDDTAANRDVLLRRLQRQGHSVEAVGDGRSALARVAEQEFDLVLLDLVMPGMNGFEVLSCLKGDMRFRHIPVIMISALDEIDSIAHCIEAGAEDYLPKPFNPILLAARINASLERKRWRDREQAFVQQLQAEKAVSEALLLNILPRTIVERMREGATLIADRIADVTILFSDIVGFTPLANRFAPDRTVALLNQLFSEFDRVAVELGLEKIKTIGDSYMVAGGLPEEHVDHAVAVAEMALRMSEVVSTTGAKVGEALAMRIGIHSGDVVAGVIGRHKFTYDVWGDTVNTASRLESCGVPHRIHISTETHDRIRHAFRCEPRGIVEIPGKGEMMTYFLDARHA